MLQPGEPPCLGSPGGPPSLRPVADAHPHYGVHRLTPPGKGIGAFLTHSYLYYHCDTSVITDEQFDALCADILTRWDTIEHRDKHLLNREDLAAGSGFAIPLGKYPRQVMHICYQIIDWQQQGRDYLKWLSESQTPS